MSNPDSPNGWVPPPNGWPQAAPSDALPAAGVPPVPSAGPPPSGYPPPSAFAPPPGFAPPPPQGYAYGYGYGYGFPQQRDHPQGVLVLIFGILGLVMCQLFAPVAWIMGTKALREIDAQPGVYSNRGVVNAGRICGIVGTVLIVLIIAFYAIFFAVLATRPSS